MRTIDEDHFGPLILHHDTRLNAVVWGDVTVCAGRQLELNGAIHGGLLLCAQSHADLRGVVSGKVRNEGGAIRRVADESTVTGAKREIRTARSPAVRPTSVA